MLYDNGGRGAPLPMPQRQQQPVYQQQQQRQPPVMPRLTGNRTQDQFNLGVYGKDFPINRFNGQGPQMGMAGGMPQQQPMYGGRPQYGFAGGGSMMGGGATGGMPMGYRRRRPLYARDDNGRVPGAWDYQQQPQYDRPPMQLY